MSNSSFRKGSQYWWYWQQMQLMAGAEDQSTLTQPAPGFGGLEAAQLLGRFSGRNQKKDELLQSGTWMAGAEDQSTSSQPTPGLKDL